MYIFFSQIDAALNRSAESGSRPVEGLVSFSSVSKPFSLELHPPEIYIYLCVEDMRFASSFRIIWFLLVIRVTAGRGPTSDSSLSSGPSELSQNQYRCLQWSKKEPRVNRTGIFCTHMWDGSLCWNETPAGTSVTQNCPDRPDLDATEKVTKYCDRSGNWIQTGSTCEPASKDKLQVIVFLRDASEEPTAEATQVRAERILGNENQCLEKMKNDPPYDKAGLYCGRNWDGWLCWDDTPAGNDASQNCPDYFDNFDPTEKATKQCGADGIWFRHPGSNMTWTNYTLCSTSHDMKMTKLKMHENEHKCLQKMKEDPPFNKAGLFCGCNWDGWLCWDNTPAGTYASQNCPDYFSDLTPAENATKFCGEDGQWFRHPESNMTWTNYTLCVGNGNERLRAAAQFSREPEVEPTTVSPVDHQQNQEIVRKKILDSQYKCFEKMNRDPPYNKSGPYCSRNWDGWLCWEDTPVGTFTSQNCPNYFDDFDPTEKATKYCGEDGQWFRHPDTNRTWSNYTLCNENTKAKLRSAYILFYMTIVGHALSIASLLISLAIFFYFRSLSCQRITLHKNLFCSYVLNSALTIIYLVTVVNNPKVVARNPVGCKVLHFFHMYMLGCNYFWMLCEGIYLHTLIVVAVFAEEQHLHWYYLLGWGFPLVPVSIHAVARKKYFDDNCWMSVETHLLYAVHGPIVAALLVNLFFLLNIIRVLVTKLRDTHRAESNMYMKAVRATLILVPLLGIQFVIFPWRPENRVAGEVYEYVMHILMHYQGLLVATIFCFFNGEVQAALKRQWMQCKTQWGQRRKDHCSMRSTSYTATSITEVPAFMYHHDCNTEHLNGRHTEDSELVALKSGDAYA
ncbi:calcitonin gene-related peptide type 1 receptor isoform X1 [Kryptolebias marmoratus]|uniref:Calcitonin gene-related peptide type 1 receptor n=2 Tax=Kryptolebias marmoratus TaxID=37003 RepID=A0A3Q3EGF8_KRYMA|nr:calcitonin gene-related peptide type 1 receptor isoform X1 [Kryptolebias marmoratus]